MSQLTAPFPWFGGKSRAASLIWDRLGKCANYVEPFAWVATFAPAIGHAIEDGGKRYRIRDIVHGNPSRLEVGLIGGVDDSV